MSPEYLILTDHDFVRLMALQPDPRLRAELERAIVVPPETIPAQVVTMHSRVRYLDESSGERREIQVVYPEEADLAEGKVSVFAPVGAALLGLSVDQAIEWDFPGGGKRRLRVEEVVDQPESRLRRTG
ncbi:MAG TPA: nucleoside diphosphate kinase regulator [Rhodocyclaceae bacterium]|nr:nucleoside diphosphate kinase regulator [Rhodocyclaceae bacterium]HMZ84702.1 nucleoside diphosphate kinase regulator [Rhodocyclaceae bacterium]HNA04431.1 nucleoside diphosphate kinase regulator [Rhodocyclaceae bacterium]HNB79724.1 nucleoside diphosphate kinase regulator [Rhodocyclaceae bacterium]HNC62370.1 nucleoside diphosphate kinase regulator [Rhodocyclaceae bacterium]